MKFPTTKQTLSDMVTHYREEADGLEAQHRGVRPAWVSTDVAIARANQAEYEAKLQEFVRGN